MIAMTNRCVAEATNSRYVIGAPHQIRVLISYCGGEIFRLGCGPCITYTLRVPYLLMLRVTK